MTVMLLTFEAPGGTRLQLFEQHGARKTRYEIASNAERRANRSLTVSYRDIAQALHNNDQVGVVNLTPICVDSAGAVYRGDPWEVNITQFALM